MTDSIEYLRRSAKKLRKSFEADDSDAITRVRAHVRGDDTDLKHSDFLHVVARENGFARWPELKFAVETRGLDRTRKQQRLKQALFYGQNWVIDRLLADSPDLAEGSFGLQVALFDLKAVRAAILADPGVTTRADGVRRPILHLAFSRYLKHAPDKQGDMLAIAKLLVENGADVNDGLVLEPDGEHPLSALYGAIGHSDNIELGAWLLAQGANPNDGESLYHATELGHHRGLELLLANGATPKGTNVLLRAIDFDDVGAIEILMLAGADPNEGTAADVIATVIPALHQAARRNASAATASVLLEHGARTDAIFKGHSAFAMASFLRNTAVADAIKAAGGATVLTKNEDLLAALAEGPAGGILDQTDLSDEAKLMMERLLRHDVSLAHLQRLAAAGIDPNHRDEMGLPAIHVAGWEGRADVVEWLLTLVPDLTLLNGFGGDLLSTIVHGSENCPARAKRDHHGCATLVMQAGASVSRQLAENAGEPKMSALLTDWLETHANNVGD